MEFHLAELEQSTHFGLGPFQFFTKKGNARQDNMSALRSFRATDLFTFNNVYAQPALDSSHISPNIHLAEIWMCGQKLSVFIVSS